MTSKATVKLTAVLATILLTLGALAIYRNGFSTGSGTGNRQQAVEEESSDPVDSVALMQGLAELRKIIDRYRHNSLLVQGEIRYYSGDSVSIPSETAPFTFGVDGENTQYELDSVLTITSTDLALIIDKREQNIAIAEKEKGEGAEPVIQPAPVAIDAFKEFISQVRISYEGQYKQLIISFTEDAPGNVLDYTILYDEKTYAIRKLRMRIADSELMSGPSAGEGEGKVTEDDELFMVDSANNALPTGVYALVQVAVYEIIYNQERPVQAGSISSANYVQVRDGQYVPSAKYKGFSILQ